MTIDNEKLLDIVSNRKPKEKPKQSIYSLNLDALKEWFEAKGEKSF